MNHRNLIAIAFMGSIAVTAFALFLESGWVIKSRHSRVDKMPPPAKQVRVIDVSGVPLGSFFDGVGIDARYSNGRFPDPSPQQPCSETQEHGCQAWHVGRVGGSSGYFDDGEGRWQLFL